MLNLLSKRLNFLSFLVYLGLFTIFLSSIVVADSSGSFYLGEVKQNQPVILTQTCSNCTFVNVTRIVYPNNLEQNLINQVMTQPVLGNFNYSFSDTSRLGKHTVTTCGNPNGEYSCVDYTFLVTTTGNNYSTIAPIFLLVGGFLFLFIGAQFRIPIMGLASGVLMGISGVYLLIYGLGFINNLYTQGIGFTSLFLGLWAGFAATYEFFINEGGEEEVED